MNEERIEEFESKSVPCVVIEMSMMLEKKPSI